MSEQVYKEMVDVMSKRGIVFGGMDISEFYRVAKALFTPEEAEINNAMPPQAFAGRSWLRSWDATKRSWRSR